MTLFHYIPLATTILSFIFSALIFKRYLQRGRKPHLLWWSFGVLVYGLGTMAESYFTLFGWNNDVFKFWYIVGALMGGAPLAQGTVWYLLKRRTAWTLTILLVAALLVSSTFVILSPVSVANLENTTPTGKAFVWQWVRFFSPFINTYAAAFLIGGALLSAKRFKRMAGDNGERKMLFDRFIGNLLIAAGAILPGIGGSFTRAGYTLVLYVTEFTGIVLIWLGYWFNIRKRPAKESEFIDSSTTVNEAVI